MKTMFSLSKKRSVRFIALLLAFVLTIPFGSIAGAAETYNFASAWGTQGTADSQFISPIGVDMDTRGYIYVADTGNHRIQKFFIEGDAAFVSKWGTLGTGDGQLNTPTGLAVDSNGYIYVVDKFNYRIQKFSSDGAFLGKWGSYGTGNGEFRDPYGIAIHSGFVYISDSSNNNIQKFSTDGTFIAQWGGTGSADGQFNCPHGVATDTAGNIYVVDHNNYRIQKFSPDGTFLGKWGSYGLTDSLFTGPTGITTDSSDKVFVTDFKNEIKVFTADGTFITKWGTSGSGNGQFNYPLDITVDFLGLGYVYVTDSENHRVQKFTPSGDSTDGSVPSANKGITVSALVEEPPTLTFSVSAVSAPTGGTITDSAIDFGKLAANTPKTAVQRLSVSTNAVNGYTVTAEEDHPLAFGINQIPDVLGDSGTITEATKGSWDNNTTYGFGFTLTNITGSDAAFSLGYRQFADKSAAELSQPVMSKTSPSADSQVDVTYKINIGAGQAAGTYTNTITYIATGNF